MPFEALIAGASDKPSNFNQPRLFQYGPNLYQFQVFGTNISAFKSTTLGQTWTNPANITVGFAFALCGSMLVGARVYIWYPVSTAIATALAYYDFTTDTFTVVSTTGTITIPATVPGSMCLCGPDANHIFALADENSNASTVINVSEYLSNVVTAVGTFTDSSHDFVRLQTVILGTSGIVHVLYTSEATSNSPTPTLKYFNIVSGVIGPAVTVLTGFSDHGLPSGTVATPVQSGSNIYLCFYVPAVQQIQMCAFPDVASPAFTISTIEPAWAIPALSVGGGTGQYVSALQSLPGNLLICFYVNTNGIFIGDNGDGILYCRTSPDNGVTWSPAQQIIAHIDPAVPASRPITAPCVLTSAAVTFPFNPLFCSYMQNPNPTGGDETLRFVPYCPPNTPPPPPPPVLVGGWTVGGF